MGLIKFSSWNVNGFRAISQKADWQNWFANHDSDLIGLQETKSSPEQVPENQLSPKGWYSWWSASVVKKGYSGVAVFAKQKPLRMVAELPDPDYQKEGRVLHLEYPDFHYLNIYFPNGGDEISKGVFKRLAYKMGFFDAFFDYAQNLRKDKPIVVCGDFNVAHKAIDLARPKDNKDQTGFLPVERAWLDHFVKADYIDTFRFVRGDVKDAYSWWSYKTRARERNVGWRIDYFFVSSELKHRIADAWIEDQVYGSDHCPIGLALNI